MATWQERFFELMAHNNFDKLVEVAKVADISPSTLNTALKKEDKVPKKDTMDKIARALNTTSKYLFFGDDDPAAPTYLMPILDRMNIGAWVEKTLSIEQCNDTLTLPYALERGFCWFVDTPDMEPFILRGDMVVCEPGFNTAFWDCQRKMFVISAAVSDQHKQPGRMINNLETGYQRLSICEFCLAAGDFLYLHYNAHYPDSIAGEPRMPIAMVRHIIRNI